MWPATTAQYRLVIKLRMEQHLYEAEDLEDSKSSMKVYESLVIAYIKTKQKLIARAGE